MGKDKKKNNSENKKYIDLGSYDKLYNETEKKQSNIKKKALEKYENELLLQREKFLINDSNYNNELENQEMELSKIIADIKILEKSKKVLLNSIENNKKNKEQNEVNIKNQIENSNRNKQNVEKNYNEELKKYKIELAKKIKANLEETRLEISNLKNKIKDNKKIIPELEHEETELMKVCISLRKKKSNKKEIDKKEKLLHEKQHDLKKRKSKVEKQNSELNKYVMDEIKLNEIFSRYNILPDNKIVKQKSPPNRTEKVISKEDFKKYEKEDHDLFLTINHYDWYEYNKEIEKINSINKKFKYIDDYQNNPKCRHRFECHKQLKLIRNIIIDDFGDMRNYKETVFIEFRPLPHMEFLLRNTILKLPDWNHSIVCGNLNYQYIKNICNLITNDCTSKINIIRIEIDNCTTSEYSKLLTTQKFWNNFKGEKILLYQEDTMLFHSNISAFLEYDYIGAPWRKGQNDNSFGVGNGGFSLRSKSKMLDCLAFVNPNKLNYNSSTLTYMNNSGNTFPPEDVYFSKCMIDNKLGNVAPRHVAENFSQECCRSENPLGGHNFYLAGNNLSVNLGIVKKKHRVAVFSPYDYTTGGGELYLSKIMKFFIDNNYIIYFFNNVSSSILKKTVTTYLGKQYIEKIKLFSDISKFYNLNRFDYFIEMSNSKIPKHMNKGIARKNIFHCQFPVDYLKNNKKTDMNSVNCVLVNSEFTKKYYLEHCIDSKGHNKVNILYPLCKISNYFSSNKKEENTYIMIGRIFPNTKGANNKNHDFVQHVFTRQPKSKLIIVGSVKDNRYYEQLKNGAKNFPNIEYHTDISDKDKERLLSTSKYVIHATGIDNPQNVSPSAEEHFGISLIEAIQYNCIPIVAKRGYPVYYIKNKKNGFLFDNGDELLEIINNIENKTINFNFKKCIETNKKIIEKYNEKNYLNNLTKILISL